MADKVNISTLTDTSWILQLVPKKFEYSKRNAANEFTGVSDGVEQLGLLAEDVATIKPELVLRDLNNDIIGVDYQKLIVPLLVQLIDLKSQLDGLSSRVDTLEGN
jgi:hypothetical protein